VVPLFGGRVVVITSRKKKRWVIPKGVVERAMTPMASAAREAFEEAGILGAVRPGTIGSYDYEKWGSTCSVEVFVMDVEQLLDTWPEAHLRERQLVSLEEATARMREPELKRMLAQLR
jgi:8-oxo-dGTP pyrophosphatase MutT (NUDIX family)